MFYNCLCAHFIPYNDNVPIDIENNAFW